MARINITRLPLPQDDFDSNNKTYLFVSLKYSVAPTSFQQDLREESTARTWFLA